MRPTAAHGSYSRAFPLGGQSSSFRDYGRCRLFQMTAPTEPKMYPITAVMTMSVTAASGLNINRLDHVRPENEVDDRLCPTNQQHERRN